MLQYDGDVIPLEDESGLLNEDEAQVTILICGSDGEESARKIGLVVRRVVDVCTGEVLGASTASQAGLLARVNQRITAMRSGLGATAALEGAA